MKNCQKVAENTKINAVFNSRKQFLISDENIRIGNGLKRLSDSLHDKEHV